MKNGKISQVKALLHKAPMSVNDLMIATGISKATAYSLPYYLGKQGFKITKGENASKEATYHITGVSNPTPKKAEVVVPVVKATKKARKVVTENLVEAAA